jgi:gliding motility-associated-like protein
MKKLLLFSIFILLLSQVYSQCVTNVNFNNWSIAGQPANGNWIVQGGGTSVRQTINGDNTYFISPYDLMNVKVTGSFRTTDNDDDWMGFVFSYLNPIGAIDDYDCWLFDWKQKNQGAAQSGMSICRILGTIPPSQYNTTFWNHQNTPEFTVVQNTFGGPGWVRNFNHAFELRLTYTRAVIYVDGNLIFDVTDCFKPGRFGFYNKSQQDCYYSNFQYDLYVDYFVTNAGKHCLGDTVRFEFVSPCFQASLAQYQSLRWDFGDGTVITNNNPTFANANVKHKYNAAGNYTATLTVTDFNGCSASSTKTIQIANPITLTPVPTQPLCNGGNNGSLGVNPTGGFGPFNYSWSTGQNTQNAIGLTAGTYTVTVTDNICTTTGQFTLNQPTALSATITKTDANCGLNNGTATVTVSGGTMPYQYVNWPTISATNVATGLGAGTYIPDFKDANGCSSLLQYSTTIAQLPCGITSSVTKTDVSCFNGTNGTATLTVTGATGTPNITWSPGGQTGSTVTNLAAGTYTYSFSDNNPAHSFTGQVTITQPSAPMVAQLSTTPVKCAGTNSGQALASVISGGTPNYSYTWSNGSANNPVANNLPSGNITVTITDNVGCTATASGNVSGAASLAVSITTTMDSCFNAGKGKAIATVTGGTPPFNYAWSNFVSTDSNLNLRSGNYSLTVTDFNNCSVTANANITTNPVLTYTYTKQNINCFGQSTGNFNVNITGGVQPYNIAWTPNSLAGTNPTNLAAGIYYFTVTDAYQCRVTGGDTIFQPDSALTAITSHTDVTCNGLNDGTITVTTSGGTPPYSFLGNQLPAGTVTIPNLAPNTYAGNIIDDKGCTFAVAETVAQPTPLSVTESHLDVACFGAATGSITLNISGGNSPYTVDWGGGVTSQNRSNIPAGNYNAVITDFNGCQATISVTIVEPSPLTIAETHTNVNCNAQNTGSIDVTTTGGVGNISYLWSNGTSTEDVSNLSAGNYCLTATDNNSCTASICVNITEPAALTVTTSHTNVTCFGMNNGSITINVSGGTSPYSFLGNQIQAGSTTISNLGPNTYSGSLLDNNNCSVSVSEIITEPTQLFVSETHTDASCNGASDASIYLAVSGGTAPYSFDWGNGVVSQNRLNISAGNYAVIVTDFYNCSAGISLNITEPASVPLAVVATDASCFGGNGSATASPTVGSSPYTFLWSGTSLNTATVSLTAGTFNVTSTSFDGCKQIGSITINEPSDITISETHVNSTCFGLANGSITINASGGTGQLSFVWQPNVSNSNSANNLMAGNYLIIASDQNGCTKAITTLVNEPNPLQLTTTNTNVSCFGLADGSISAFTNGGTPGYSFEATANGNVYSSQNGSFSSLQAGLYNVKVTDGNGCSSNTSIQVLEPPAIVLNSTVKDATCNKYSDGSVQILASGGTPNYQYSFNSGEQNGSGLFLNLTAGNYSVTVFDLNNCSASSNINVGEPDAVVITALPNPTQTSLGVPVQLNISSNQQGAVSYSWVPSTGLSCNNCDNPVFDGIKTVTYNIFVSTSLGCSGSSELTATVIPDYTLYLPNTFSPNNDGSNDFLQVFGNLNAVKLFEIKVFNRWGEMVFASSDKHFNWDGFSGGKKLPVGVYVYTLKCVFIDNHTNNTYKGTLTILE